MVPLETIQAPVVHLHTSQECNSLLDVGMQVVNITIARTLLSIVDTIYHKVQNLSNKYVG